MAVNELGRKKIRPPASTDPTVALCCVVRHSGNDGASHVSIFRRAVLDRLTIKQENKK